MRISPGDVIEGGQLEEAGVGIHSDFEALEDVGAYDSVGSGGEAAPGDLDETFFEGQISEGHGAGQGDSRFGPRRRRRSRTGWKRRWFPGRGRGRRGD